MTIKLLVLDVDGVMTSGRLYYGADGEVLKAFHVHDGLGIKVARANGMEVAVISAKDSPPLRRRLQDLGIVHFALGSGDKAAAFDTLLNDLALTADQVAYVGDDVIDLKVMRQVAYPIAVNNAQPAVLKVASYKTRLAGGEGAVREAIDHILERQVGLDVAYRDYL